MELRRIQVPIWGYVVLICGANWLTTGATGANSSSQPDQPKLDVELSTSIVESAPAPATIIGHPPSKSQLLEELPVVGQETIPFSTKGAIQVLVPVPDSRGQHESQQSVEDRQPRHQQYAPDQYKKQQPPRQLLLPARGKIFDYNHQMATLDLNKDSSLAKAHSLKDNQPRSSLDAIGRASIGPESKMLATKMRHHNVKVCRRRSLFEVLRGSPNVHELLLRTARFVVNVAADLNPFGRDGYFGNTIWPAVWRVAGRMPEFRQNNDNNKSKQTSFSLVRALINEMREITFRGQVEVAMGWIERSVERLPYLPRLHPQECVKRSICEAHNDPDKYGAIGFVLRLMFPATNISSTDSMDDMEYKVVNKYRHAAGYGLNKRLDANGTSTGSGSVCRDKYEDCLVSLLDVSKSLVDKFLT